MPSIAETYVSIFPDTSRIAAGVKEAFAKIDGKDTGRRLGREIQEGIGDVKVGVDADTTKAKAEIDAIGGKDVTIHVDVDRDSVAGVSSAISTLAQESSSLTSASSGAADGVSGLGKSLGSIAAASGPASIAILIGAASAAVELAGVAASAAQALWLLPAAAGAAGTAVGTLALATAGFSDALGAMGDPEKFAESLKSLAPNAQQAALSIYSMMPALTGLQQATQNALFAGVGEQLNQIVNQYLPTIQSMTTGIASAFNSMFSGVADQLLTPQTQATLQTFMTNVTSAFQQLAPAAAPFVKALTDIASVGSGFLPELAKSAADAARSFSTFITEAKNSGDLKRWMGEGLDTLKQLGGIAIGLAQAFMQLAPTGREILPQIATMLTNIKDIMPAISAAALLLGPPIGAWVVGINQAASAFDAIKGIVTSVGNFVIPIINNIGQTLDKMLDPIRAGIAVANSFGAGIPDIPHYTGINQIGGVPTQGGYAGAQAARRGASDGTTLPTAGLPGMPTGGFGSPSTSWFPGQQKPGTWGGPAPARTPNADGTWGSSAVPPLPVVPTAGALGTTPAVGQVAEIAKQFGLTLSSGKRNEPGSYHNSGEAGDFSNGSGNTPQELAFAQYMAQNFGPQLEELIYSDPAFSQLIGNGQNVTGTGYYSDKVLSEHMNHVHVALKDALGGAQFAPASAAAASAGAPSSKQDIANLIVQSALARGYSMDDAKAILAYSIGESGLNPAISGGQQGDDEVIGLFQEKTAFSGGLSREQRMDPSNNINAYLNQLDKHRGMPIEQALPATSVGGPLSGAGRQAWQPLMAQADQYMKNYAPGASGMPTGQPTDPMYIALSPNQKAASKDSGGNQLGQDILGGMGEIFGLDGSVFKDPTQFGLFKIMKGLMGLKFADGGQGGGGGGTGFDGGGGGGGLGGILSAIPQAFGDLKVGSPKDAPGQFMPSNPGAGGTGGMVLNPFAPPGVAGPGNQQAGGVNIDMSNSNYGYSKTAVQDSIQQSQLPPVRVGTLHGPASQ